MIPQTFVIKMSCRPDVVWFNNKLHWECIDYNYMSFMQICWFQLLNSGDLLFLLVFNFESDRENFKILPLGLNFASENNQLIKIVFFQLPTFSFEVFLVFSHLVGVFICQPFCHQNRCKMEVNRFILVFTTVHFQDLRQS